MYFNNNSFYSPTLNAWGENSNQVAQSSQSPASDSLISYISKKLSRNAELSCTFVQR